MLLVGAWEIGYKAVEQEEEVKEQPTSQTPQYTCRKSDTHLKTQQEMQLTSTEPGEVLYDPVIHGDSVVYVWVSMISSIVYGMHLTYQ